MDQIKDQILLSVIVPCFNEINTLDKVINKIQNSPVDSKGISVRCPAGR